VFCTLCLFLRVRARVRRRRLLWFLLLSLLLWLLLLLLLLRHRLFFFFLLVSWLLLLLMFTCNSYFTDRNRSRSRSSSNSNIIRCCKDPATVVVVVVVPCPYQWYGKYEWFWRVWLWLWLWLFLEAVINSIIIIIDIVIDIKSHNGWMDEWMYRTTHQFTVELYPLLLWKIFDRGRGDLLCGIWVVYSVCVADVVRAFSLFLFLLFVDLAVGQSVRSVYRFVEQYAYSVTHHPLPSSFSVK